MKTLTEDSIHIDAAQNIAPEEPESAFDVTFTIVEAKMMDCHGWMGYMDMYTTADWTDHMGRVSRLVRTETAWGITTEASWNHPCPTKTWIKNAGRNAPNDSEPPCSVSFTVCMESFGGLSLPEPLGNAVSFLQDVVDTCDGRARGSKRVEYPLENSGSLVGSLVVECEFVPSVSRGRMSSLMASGMFPAPASDTSSVEEASVSSATDLKSWFSSALAGSTAPTYLRELGLGNAAGQAGPEVQDPSPRGTASASPRSTRISRKG